MRECFRPFDEYGLLCRSAFTHTEEQAAQCHRRRRRDDFLYEDIYFLATEFARRDFLIYARWHSAWACKSRVSMPAQHRDIRRLPRYLQLYLLPATWRRGNEDAARITQYALLDTISRLLARSR